MVPTRYFFLHMTFRAACTLSPMELDMHALKHLKASISYSYSIKSSNADCTSKRLNRNRVSFNRNLNRAPFSFAQTSSDLQIYIADNLILPWLQPLLATTKFSEHISACFYFKWEVPPDRRLCDSDDMGVGTYITLDKRSMPTTNAFICNISTRFISETLSLRSGSSTALKLDVSQCLKSYCGHDSTMNSCICSISFITLMRL